MGNPHQTRALGFFTPMMAPARALGGGSCVGNLSNGWSVSSGQIEGRRFKPKASQSRLNTIWLIDSTRCQVLTPPIQVAMDDS